MQLKTIEHAITSEGANRANDVDTATDNRTLSLDNSSADASRAQAQLARVAAATNALAGAIAQVTQHGATALDDLMLSCEAFATVTGPDALRRGDAQTLRDEARALTRQLRALTATGAANGVEAASAQSLANLQGPLRDVLLALAPLASGASLPVPVKARRTGGTQGRAWLVPATILTGALTLLILLLSSISFSAGVVVITPHGVVFEPTPVFNAEGTLPNATATPHTSSGGPRATPPPGAKPTPPPHTPQATPTPGGAPPPVSPPPTSTSATFVISPTSLIPCADTEFNLTLTGGANSATWTAVTDSNEVGLRLTRTGTLSSQVGGTLQLGVSVSVHVAQSPSSADVRGDITVTVSGAQQTQSVAYDTTSCATALSEHGGAGETERSGSSSGRDHNPVPSPVPSPQPLEVKHG